MNLDDSLDDEYIPNPDGSVAQGCFNALWILAGVVMIILFVVKVIL